MRTVKWNAFLPGLCGLAVALGVMVASARADVTSERGASILIFPKVVWYQGSNTIIQITNISNDLVFARCFYVNAQLQYPGIPEHPLLNPPLCAETDFEIRLTRQQPTHWLVSEGRGVDPFDFCESGSTPTCINTSIYRDLNGFGIDPGAVPPVSSDFVGELKCVEVDASGVPLAGNHLKGEATITSGNGDISKYSAVGIEAKGGAVGATGNELRLDYRGPDTAESTQYAACPAELHLNHFAEGEVTENSLSDFTSSVNTELTLVPCSEDLENQIPATVTLQFKIYNEFEVPFSTSTSLTCWKNIELSDIGNSNVFDASVLGSDVAYSKITPADSKDGGVIAVAEEFHSYGSSTARAAFNVHTRGDRFFGAEGTDPDRIVLPGQQ